MARPRLLALIALATLTPARPHAICEQPFCVCAPTPAAHSSWTTINCTVPHDKNLDILEGHLPELTTDLIITGAESVMFGPNSLSGLKDLRHIRVSDVRVALMRKYTAINLNVVSTYLDIRHCEVLRIEENTFSNIKGPLSVSLYYCDYVSVEKQAFSWLISISIAHTTRLELNPEAFILDPSAANIGEHGPGMTIALHNLTIPEIPAQAFGSSAASITMESLEVQAIRTGAFSANTYNSVLAVNSTFHSIEGEAFAQQSLIKNLQFSGCRIHRLDSKAIESAIANLNISRTWFDIVGSSAINATVASVIVLDNIFNNFQERGFELSSWNKFHMERNSFGKLASNAIISHDASIQQLTFTENEIEYASEKSLAFIGEAHVNSPKSINYKRNYFGNACHCNITIWLSKVFGKGLAELYEAESYCTLDDFFARCFDIPERNMVVNKFIDGACGESTTIKCEMFNSKDEAKTKNGNPRFLHKKEHEEVSDRNKKVIGIVIVTCVGSVVIVILISIVRCLKRKAHSVDRQNFLMSSHTSCATFCDRIFHCGGNEGIDNARSRSQSSMISERHPLNEPRLDYSVEETHLPEVGKKLSVSTDDKTTQTFPEELTKELLENLRKKLEDPENYVEAREMIEHLYELIKVEEGGYYDIPTLPNTDNNIYEVPSQTASPRIGKNKKQMINVGTRIPSLDKLLLPPRNKQTALAHEYFEPKDFAVHLYAEIAKCDKEQKPLSSNIPDVVEGTN